MLWRRWPGEPLCGTPSHARPAYYNGERFLAQSLDALLAQTFTDFELIISDNGSTDRTG